MTNYSDSNNLTLREVAKTFIGLNCNMGVEKINKGLINSTYLITPDPKELRSQFILQSVNKDIFSKPEDVIYNYLLLEESFNLKRTSIDNHMHDYLKLPKLLLNSITQDKFIVKSNSFWRAFEYLTESKTFEKLPSPSYAEKIFKCLSSFHFLSSELNKERLTTILSNFHDTAYIYQQFENELDSFVSRNDISNKILDKFSELVDYAISNKEEAFLLSEAKSNKLIANRAAHGDPKVNNFVFDTLSEDVIALIDSDTLQPGYILDDIADCVRSSCNPGGEEPSFLSEVYFDLDFFELSLKGYFFHPYAMLNQVDMFYLPLNIRSITFELGLRFLTDFMRDNIYFKVSYPSQNLYRTEVQFHLLSSIKSKWVDIIGIMNGLN